MSAGKIYIVGDLMIDNNHHCSCNRIAPEAPLPVYKLINSDYVLGGCGNVAVNVHKLYSNVSLLSVIGDDDWAAKCKHKIKEFGIIGADRASYKHTEISLRVIISGSSTSLH